MASFGFLVNLRMLDRLGFLVEGPGDEKVIAQILGKLGKRFRIRNARGSGNLKRKALSFIRLLTSSNCTKIIILRDLDCMDYEAVQREFSVYLSNKTKLCIVVHELESWLLADNNALSELLGKQVRAIPNPESIHDAKSRMKKIFEKSGKKHIPSRDLPEIARHIDLNVVRKKCESYFRFEALMENCRFNTNPDSML